MGARLADGLTIPAMGAPADAAHSHALALARALGLRLLWFLATLAGAALLVQVLLAAAPGDPVDLVPNGEEMRPLLEKEWGLDQPLPVRFGSMLVRAASGDLGTSLTVRPGAPVAELVLASAGRSLLLLVPALLCALAVAIGLAGFTSGQASALRRIAQAVSVAPVFLMAYLLVVGVNEATFALMERGTIERPDWFALPDQPSFVRTALGIAVLAVGSGTLGELHAACEDELVRLRGSAFVDAARARGAALWPHVLLNLVPPVTTIAANRTAFLVGGLVVLEKVLLLNGAGALLWEACLRRDYPLATGLVLAAALAVCGSRLLGDAVRIAVDPRVRAGAG